MDVLSTLISGIRGVCTQLTDVRRGENVVHRMVDVAMSAFSMFFMQSESFLSHQRALEEGQGISNCQTLFGIEKTASDNHIRSLLDEVHPTELQPAFDLALNTLRENGGLKLFQRLDGRTPIAIDGTEYFCSQKPGCPHCLTRKRGNGKTECYHTMLSATIVAPGHDKAIPLMPEFIANTDGSEKQDCERNAGKRWLETHHERVKDLRPVYLGDALFACQPMAEAVLATGADFLFVCKPDGHKTLYDFINGAALDEHKTTELLPGKKRLHYHYHWIEGVPLRDGKDALHVNWIAVTITGATGKKGYDGAFVTNLPVTMKNVVELVAVARARWKIENESFNVLKNNGYHLEHNFGHGKKYLAMIFAALNLLAFAAHTICDSLDELWKRARAAKGSRKRFFEHLRTITTYIIFESWQALLDTLIAGRPPPFQKTTAA